jgi:hypothetical protein
MHLVEQTLEERSREASRLEQVRRRDLRSGDWVLVTTRNSRYTICTLDDDSYLVSGGWFDRKGLSPQKISIHGCTWGGSALKHDIVAARGLFLEFGNRVLTTRIQQVLVIRRAECETPC